MSERHDPTGTTGGDRAADAAAHAAPGAANNPKASDTTKAAPARKRRRFWLFGGAAATAIAIAACAQSGPGGGHHGWSGHGWGGHGWGGHHHRHGWGAGDPEDVARRIDKVVEWVLSDVNASDEQKRKVAAIAKRTAVDLAPLREQHRAARREGVDLLAAPTIDRAAVERLRAAQIAGADAASRKLVAAMVEISETLTPEQRVKLKERLERRMRGRRG